MKPRARDLVHIGPPEADRHIVVKLKTTQAARRALSDLRSARSPRRAGGTVLERVMLQSDMESMQPLFPTRSQERQASTSRLVMSFEPEETDDELAGLNVMRFSCNESASKACKKLEQDRTVEFAHVAQERFPFGPRTSTVLDPLEFRQWGLAAVRLYEARKQRGFQDARDVPIAVIDSGVDKSHPDLKGIISEEHNFTPGPLEDTAGHGTHVCGIAAAVSNNQVGISGICQSRRILSLKALNPYDGPGYYRALRHATDHASVINLSLGGGSDRTEALLVERAIRRGVVVVAAMGNEFLRGNPTSFPAAIDGVIAVGATDEVDRRGRFSNTGPHISLCAPGVNVLSTVPTYPSSMAETTDYEAWPGTSMATPFVAAAAALILAKKPDLPPAQVKRYLERGADKVPGQRGFSEEFGHGRLNIAKTLALLR